VRQDSTSVAELRAAAGPREAICSGGKKGTWDAERRRAPKTQPMPKTLPPVKRIDVLVNTLVGERYARRPLLSELLDELSQTNDRPEAIVAGRALLAKLDSGIDELEYEESMGRIVELTCPEWFALAAE